MLGSKKGKGGRSNVAKERKDRLLLALRTGLWRFVRIDGIFAILVLP